METIYLGIIVFLFVLAIFDLVVGVSNDAVNFLNSAIGAKAASFKTIIFIAGVGVFIGAALSNGMMDIARHGIYQPQHFYFAEIMCIMLAVMLTDVVLLDVFNTMGMPTSTTVSMVFELLGGTFALALIKVYSSEGTLGLGDLINTDKALSVIMAIFVSVAIAFFFGMCSYIAVSKSVKTAMGTVKKSNCDFVEIMPGIALRQISEFAALGKNLIAGGLIETREDADAALKAGAKAAVDGAESTKSFKAALGRAGTVGDKSIGYPDAGAYGLGVIFTELANFICSK